MLAKAQLTDDAASTTPGGRRAAAHRALHIGRQKAGNAHHQRAVEEAGEAADRDDPVAPQLQRQHRLRRAPLVQRQRRQSNRARQPPAPRGSAPSALPTCTSASIGAPTPSISSAEPR